MAELATLAESFRDAAIALLPPGAALSKEPDAKIGRLLLALVHEFARVQLATDVLGWSAPPSSLGGYLDDWEHALGLPGECVGAAPATDDERAGAINAKLAGRRSRNQSAYEAAAAALGYPEIVFERHTPLTADAFVAGADATGDGWAFFVRIVVQVSNQTADDTLLCTLRDQLRRAHGFIELVREGPMGAERKHYESYFNAQALSANFTGTPFEIRYSGQVSIVLEVTNGAGIAPTDAPIGSWVYETSVDGVRWVADLDTAITTPLATLNPVGNTLISKVAKLSGVAGRYGRLRYARTSGGSTSAKVTASISTW